jgi:phage major head subunit gpT-like protein
MGVLTQSFVFDLETNMRIIQEDAYSALNQELVWSDFVKVFPSSKAKEIFTWLISTAKIEDTGVEGGKMIFEDMISQQTTFQNRNAVAGLRMKRQQLEDLDGDGVSVATKWSSDVGAYMAYWPQKQFANALKNGHTGAANVTYDGLNFFHNAHFVNGKDVAQGTFANLFTGAASSTPSTDPGDAIYPGALPIDASVTEEVALANLGKAIAYIKSIKMPNGEDPRHLKPTTLIVSPDLEVRARALTKSKFIAKAASSGGGSADVEAVIQGMGFDIVVMDELSGFEGGTTYFLACRELASKSQLGAFVYLDREPFKITYYTGQGGGTGTDAELDRKDELEWHCKGRNVLGYGHPFLMFKCKAT